MSIYSLPSASDAAQSSPYLGPLFPRFLRHSICRAYLWIVLRGCTNLRRAFALHEQHPAHYGVAWDLDGIALPIAKPQDKYFPRHYYTRKGFYALPVQCICDASYRFLYMSARCVGSTHESLAWACSMLGSRFPDGLNIGEYWIAADAAYSCENHLLTPFTKAQVHDPELGQRRDAFNFYHTSLCMHVEQSFGILVARFGILWRSLRFPLSLVPRILSACMRIHNFCVDQNVPVMSATLGETARSATEEAFLGWWKNVEETRDPDSQQGRRTDLESGSKRECLSNLLHTAGVTRPR
jgi:DDE superfamily endonuclease